MLLQSPKDSLKDSTLKDIEECGLLRYGRTNKTSRNMIDVFRDMKQVSHSMVNISMDKSVNNHSKSIAIRGKGFPKHSNISMKHIYYV
jgi:hypothetical protein